MFTLLGFVVIAVVLLGSAAFAVTRLNLIHAGLAFALTWLAVGAFYLWAGAEFVGLAQILVYVGAVSMVILFAVLLTQVRSAATSLPINLDDERRLGAGLITAGSAFGLLGAAILTGRPAAPAAPDRSLTAQELGTALMGPHVVALLVIGVLLTAVLIGAVLIAAPTDPEIVEDGP
jgi:NADH:ubiquinone oxidoreductase subunit 6 (subunit J)